MRTREEGPEVRYAADDVVAVTAADIEELKLAAERNERRRVRLCAHRDVGDALHDMLIVHRRETYVRPHKHLAKPESFHVVEGLGRVLLFEGDGSVTTTIPLGDYRSGRPFYYRLADPVFHMLVIDSDVMVFHESAPGPFRRSDTVFPPWAPAEGEAAAVQAFLERIRGRAGES